MHHTLYLQNFSFKRNIGEKSIIFLHIELLHYCNNIFGAQLLIIAIINKFLAIIVIVMQ